MGQATVIITPRSVSPKTCTINARDTVVWQVEETSGTVDIDFDGTEHGPFPASGSSENPSRGVYTRSGAGEIPTLTPDRSGTFTYTVTVDGTSVDPAIEVIE